MAKRYNNFFLEEEPPKTRDITPNAEVSIQFDTAINDKEMTRKLFDDVLNGEGMTQDQLFEYVKSNPDSARKIVGKYAPRNNDANFEENRYSKQLITALDQGDFDNIRSLYNNPTQTEALPETQPAEIAQTVSPADGQPLQVTQALPTTEQPAPEQKPYYKTLDEIKADVAKGSSPMRALMNSNAPVLDEKKQARLKRIAAINSIGKGLGTVLQGFYGKKGATITPDTNALLPETYKEYTSDLDKYEAKKDLWNKDMMALELNDDRESQRRFENIQNQKREDDAYNKKMAAALAAEEREREYETLKFDRQAQFTRDMADAKNVNDQNAARQSFIDDMKKLGAQFSHQKAMQEAQLKAYKERAEISAKAAAAKSGVVSRQPGTETNPFVFRSGGKQVILNADQLDIVEDIMNNEAGDGTTMESYNFNKIRDRIMKDGKISESEAREILQYADKYYTFENGMAIPKYDAEESATGGAY